LLYAGKLVKFSGSDLTRHKEQAVLIAVGGVTNRSPYTRFSTAGGGQLIGFEEGEAEQYRINQAGIESALMYEGFSWQHESHWKEINDTKNHQITTLLGHYFQAGYFFSSTWDWYPEQLEVALRYSLLAAN
jgi:phosphate-selective porin OprO/OprP